MVVAGVLASFMLGLDFDVEQWSDVASAKGSIPNADEEFVEAPFIKSDDKESLWEFLRFDWLQFPLASCRSSSAEHEARFLRLEGELVSANSALPVDEDLFETLVRLSRGLKEDVKLLMMLLMELMLLLHNKSNLPLVEELFGVSRPSIGVGGRGLSAARLEIAAIGPGIDFLELELLLLWLMVSVKGELLELLDWLDGWLDGEVLPNDGDKIFSMLNLSDLMEFGDSKGWCCCNELTECWSIDDWPLAAAATAAATPNCDPIFE